MRHGLTLTLFIVLTLGGGTLIGFATLPGEWYAGLAKPPFNPPDWVFAPVWTLLYVVVAVAGWRTWRRAPRGPGMTIWFAQLALNYLWSPVFFGAHRPGAALIVVLVLLTTILAFMAVRWQHDRVAALLFAPYATWVAFASALNAAILALN